MHLCLTFLAFLLLESHVATGVLVHKKVEVSWRGKQLRISLEGVDTLADLVDKVVKEFIRRDILTTFIEGIEKHQAIQLLATTHRKAIQLQREGRVLESLDEVQHGGVIKVIEEAIVVFHNENSPTRRRLPLAGVETVKDLKQKVREMFGIDTNRRIIARQLGVELVDSSDPAREVFSRESYNPYFSDDVTTAEEDYARWYNKRFLEESIPKPGVEVAISLPVEISVRLPSWILEEVPLAFPGGVVKLNYYTNTKCRTLKRRLKWLLKEAGYSPPEGTEIHIFVKYRKEDMDGPRFHGIFTDMPEHIELEVEIRVGPERGEVRKKRNEIRKKRNERKKKRNERKSEKRKKRNERKKKRNEMRKKWNERKKKRNIRDANERKKMNSKGAVSCI